MIDKITIAVESMDDMVGFYSQLLGMEPRERELQGHTLFSGRWGDLEVLFCPKDLAGVDARINTIQLRFVVPDVGDAFDRGIRHGGAAITEPQVIDGVPLASLRDPDGNSLELREDPTGPGA